MTMDHLKALCGTPKRTQVDNGSEFISHALDHWAYENGVTLDFSRPGKPTDNPFIESFHGSYRDECLNVHWFLSIDDAREKIESWRCDYNEFRPHSCTLCWMLGWPFPGSAKAQIRTPRVAEKLSQRNRGEC